MKLFRTLFSFFLVLVFFNPQFGYGADFFSFLVSDHYSSDILGTCEYLYAGRSFFTDSFSLKNNQETDYPIPLLKFSETMTGEIHYYVTVSDLAENETRNSDYFILDWKSPFIDIPSQLISSKNIVFNVKISDPEKSLSQVVLMLYRSSDPSQILYQKTIRTQLNQENFFDFLLEDFLSINSETFQGTDSFPLLQEGVYVLKVQAWDLVGHLSVKEVKVIIDQTPPVIQKETFESDYLFVSEGKKVQFQLQVTDNFDVVTVRCDGEVVSGINGVFTGERDLLSSIATTNLASETLVTVHFTITDAAGNQTLLDKPIRIIRALIGPKLHIQDYYVSIQKPLRLTVDTTELQQKGFKDARVQLTLVERSLDLVDGAYQFTSRAVLPMSEQITYVIPDGFEKDAKSHYYGIKAVVLVDGVERLREINFPTVSDNRWIQIVNKAPDLTELRLDRAYYQPSQQLVVTGNLGDKLENEIDSITYSLRDLNDSFHTEKPYQISTLNMKDGTYELKIQALSKYGFSAEKVVTFTVDSVCPDILVASSNFYIPVWDTGEREILVSVNESVQGLSWGLVSPSVVALPRQENGAFVWTGKSADGEWLSNGVYHVMIDAEDFAGNRGQKEIVIQNESEAPVLTILSDFKAFNPKTGNPSVTINANQDFEWVCLELRKDGNHELLGSLEQKALSKKGTKISLFSLMDSQVFKSGSYKLVLRGKSFVASKEVSTEFLFVVRMTEPKIEPRLSKTDLVGAETLHIENLASMEKWWGFRIDILNEKREFVYTHYEKTLYEPLDIAKFEFGFPDFMGNGIYYIRLTTIDDAGNQYQVELPVIFRKVMDGNVILTLDKDYFTPNGDALNDELAIKLQIQGSETTYNLKVMILDDADRLIKTLYEGLALNEEKQFSWKGYDDKKVFQLDGRYQLKVALFGRSDQLIQEKRVPIYLVQTCPRLMDYKPTSFYISPNGDGVQDQLLFQDRVQLSPAITLYDYPKTVLLEYLLKKGEQEFLIQKLGVDLAQNSFIQFEISTANLGGLANTQASYNVFIQLTDALGNKTVYSDSPFMIDLLKPNQPEIRWVGKRLTNEASVRLQAKIDDGQRFRVYRNHLSILEGTANYKPVTTSKKLTTKTMKRKLKAQDFTGDENVDVWVPLVEGANQIQLVALDMAGNLSATSDAVMVTQDITTPQLVDVISSDLFPGLGQFVDIKMIYSKALDQTKTPSVNLVYGAIKIPCSVQFLDDKTILAHVQVVSVNIEATFNIESQAVFDLAGNSSDILLASSDTAHESTLNSTVLSLYIDTILPSIPTLTVFISTTNQNISPILLEKEVGTFTEIYVNQVRSPEISEPVSFNVPLQLGVNTIQAVAVDRAGNRSPTTAVQTIFYESDVPYLKTYELSANPIKAGLLTVTFNFSESLRVTPSLSLVSNSLSLVSGQLSVVSGNIFYRGVFEIPVTLNGTFNILVMDIQDLAGNIGSANIPILVDTMAPSLHSYVLSAHPIKSGLLIVTLNFSEDLAVTPDVFLGDLMGKIHPISNCVYVASFNILSGMNGTYNIAVSHLKDVAGNTATGEITRLVIDTVAPSLNSYVLSVNPIKAGLLIVTFNFSEGLAVTPGISLGSLMGKIQPISTTIFVASFNISEGMNGTYNIALSNLRDMAGNTAMGEITELVIDTVAPSLNSYILSANPIKAGLLIVTLNFSENLAVTPDVVLGDLTGTIQAISNGIYIVSFNILEGMNGTYNIVLSHLKDLAGNTATADIADLVIDTVAPQIGTINVTPFYAKEGTVTVSFIASEWVATPDVFCHCQVMSGVYGATMNVYVYRVASHDAQGTATVQIRILDQAGNETVVTSDLFVIDTLAPVVPTLTISVPITNQNFGIISLEKEMGTFVEIYVNGFEMRNEKWSTFAEASADEEMGEELESVSFNIPLKLGVNTIQAVVVDRAGNRSPASPCQTILFESDVPYLKTYELSANPVKAGLLTVTLNFSENLAVTPDVVLGDLTGTIQAISNGIYIVSFNILEGMNGTYNIVLSHLKDLAGNTATADIADLVIDTVAPQIGTINVTPFYAKEGMVTVHVLPTEQVVTMSIVVYGKRLVAVAPFNGVEKIFIYDVASRDIQGIVNAEIIMVDTAGNQTVVQRDLFVIDTISPTVNLIQALPFYAKAGLVSLNFTASEALTTVSVTFNGKNFIAVSPIGDSLQTFFYRVTPYDSQGTACVQLRLVDYAGNTRVITQNLFVVDTVAPTLNTIQVTPYFAKEGLVTLNFTASEAIATACITFNGKKFMAVTSTGDSLHQTFVYSVAHDDPQGMACVQMTLLDNAGNETTILKDLFVIDTVLPTLNSYVLSANPVKAGLLIITCNFSEDLAITPDIVLGSLTGKIQSISKTIFVVSFNIPEGMNGTYPIALSLQDFAGNKASAGITELVIDTILPTLNSIQALPFYAKAGLVSLNFTASEALITASVTFNGKNFIAVTPIGDSLQTFVYTVTPYDSQGTAQVQLRLVDYAGNTRVITQNLFVVDTVKPTFNTIQVTPYFAKEGLVTLNFTASEPIATACITFNGEKFTAVTSTGNPLHQTFVYSVKPHDPQGMACVQMTILDNAGNETTILKDLFVIDTVLPTLNTIQAVPFYAKEGRVMLNFTTSEALTTASVTFNGKKLTALTPNGDLLHQTFVYSVVPDDLQGTATVAVCLTDYAGNQNLMNRDLFVIDTVAPALEGDLIPMPDTYPLYQGYRYVKDFSVRLNARLKERISSYSINIQGGAANNAILNAEQKLLQFYFGSNQENIPTVSLSFYDLAGNYGTYCWQQNPIRFDRTAPQLISTQFRGDPAPICLGDKVLEMRFNEPVTLNSGSLAQFGTSAKSLNLRSFYFDPQATDNRTVLVDISARDLDTLSSTINELSVSGITDIAGNVMPEFHTSYELDLVLPMITSVNIYSEKLSQEYGSDVTFSIQELEKQNLKISDGLLRVEVFFSEVVSTPSLAIESFGLKTQSGTLVFYSPTRSVYEIKVDKKIFEDEFNQNDILTALQVFDATDIAGNVIDSKDNEKQFTMDFAAPSVEVHWANDGLTDKTQIDSEGFGIIKPYGVAGKEDRIKLNFRLSEEALVPKIQIYQLRPNQKDDLLIKTIWDYDVTGNLQKDYSFVWDGTDNSNKLVGNDRASAWYYVKIYTQDRAGNRAQENLDGYIKVRHMELGAYLTQITPTPSVSGTLNQTAKIKVNFHIYNQDVATSADFKAKFPDRKYKAFGSGAVYGRFALRVYGQSSTQNPVYTVTGNIYESMIFQDTTFIWPLNKNLKDGFYWVELIASDNAGNLATHNETLNSDTVWTVLVDQKTPNFPTPTLGYVAFMPNQMAITSQNAICMMPTATDNHTLADNLRYYYRVDPIASSKNVSFYSTWALVETNPHNEKMVSLNTGLVDQVLSLIVVDEAKNTANIIQIPIIYDVIAPSANLVFGNGIVSAISGIQREVSRNLDVSVTPLESHFMNYSLTFSNSADSGFSFEKETQANSWNWDVCTKNGIYTLNLQLKDYAGNTTVVTQSILIDNVLPVITNLIYPLITTHNPQEVGVFASDLYGVTLMYSLNDEPAQFFGSVIHEGKLTKNILLAENQYNTLTFYAYDRVGNFTSESVRICQDNTAPFYTLKSYDGKDYATTWQPVWTAIILDGLKDNLTQESDLGLAYHWDVYWDGSCWRPWQESDGWAGLDYRVGLGWNIPRYYDHHGNDTEYDHNANTPVGLDQRNYDDIRIPGHLISDGCHQLMVRVKDLAGNVNLQTSIYKVDTHVPNCSADAEPGNLWKQEWPKIMATFNDSGTVEAPVQSSGWKTRTYCWDNGAVNSIPVTSGNLVVIPTTNLSDGVHILRLYCQDNAGWEASWSGTYKVDSQAPTYTLKNYNGKDYAHLWQQTWTPIVLDGLQDNLTGQFDFGFSYHWDVYWDGTKWRPWQESDGWIGGNLDYQPELGGWYIPSYYQHHDRNDSEYGNRPYSYTPVGIDYPIDIQVMGHLIPDGAHTLWVRVYDQAGNVNLQTGVYQVDTTPPAVNQPTFPNSIYFGATQIPVALGTVTENNVFSHIYSYEVRRNGVWIASENFTSSPFTLHLNENVLRKRDVITVKQTCVDLAGNIGSASNSTTVQNSVPVIQKVTLSDSTMTADNASVYTITVVVSDADGYSDLKDVGVYINKGGTERGYLKWSFPNSISQPTGYGNAYLTLLAVNTVSNGGSVVTLNYIIKLSKDWGDIGSNQLYIEIKDGSGVVIARDGKIDTNIPKFSVIPCTPSNLSLTRTKFETNVNIGDIVLYWNSVGATAAWYDIYRDNQYIASVNRTTFTDSNRTSEQTYKYYVRAVNSSNTIGSSSSSDSYSITIPDFNPPSKPAAPSVKWIDGGLNSRLQIVTITLPSSVPLDVVKWDISQTNGAGTFTQSSISKTTTSVSQLVADNQTVSYRIRWYDSAGNWSTSDMVGSVAIPDRTPPSYIITEPLKDVNDKPIWNYKQRYFTITANETVSTIDRIIYKWNDSQVENEGIITTQNPIIINITNYKDYSELKGNQTLYFKIFDKEGNYVSASRTYYVDYNPPKVNFIACYSPTSNPQFKPLNECTNSWGDITTKKDPNFCFYPLKGPLFIYYVVTDNCSSWYEIKVTTSIEAGTYIQSPQSETLAPVTLCYLWDGKNSSKDYVGSGTYYYCVYVEDSAGLKKKYVFIIPVTYTTKVYQYGSGNLDNLYSSRTLDSAHRSYAEIFYKQGTNQKKITNSSTDLTSWSNPVDTSLTTSAKYKQNWYGDFYELSHISYSYWAEMYINVNSMRFFLDDHYIGWKDIRVDSSGICITYQKDDNCIYYMQLPKNYAPFRSAFTTAGIIKNLNLFIATANMGIELLSPSQNLQVFINKPTFIWQVPTSSTVVSTARYKIQLKKEQASVGEDTTLTGLFDREWSLLDREIIKSGTDKNTYSYTPGWKDTLAPGFWRWQVSEQLTPNSSVTTSKSAGFEVVPVLEVEGVINYPNPFKTKTKIRYKLSKDADEVLIRIYTLAGGLVRELSGDTTASSLFAEYHDVEWDGTNEQGDTVLNGVYFYKVIVVSDKERVEKSGKMIKLR